MSESIGFHFEHASDDPALSGTPVGPEPRSHAELASVLRELVRSTRELQHEIGLVERGELAQVSGSAVHLHNKAMRNAERYLSLLERA